MIDGPRIIPLLGIDTARQHLIHLSQIWESKGIPSLPSGIDPGLEFAHISLLSLGPIIRFQRRWAQVMIVLSGLVYIGKKLIGG